MKQDRPRISVVVCTRDRADDLRRALTGLEAQAFVGFEVIVVDQSRTDQTQRLVRQFQPRLSSLRLVRQSEPGLSRAYNRGVREAEADVLAFTDDDCLVAADWLSSVWRALAAGSLVDVLYGQVLAPPELDGTAATSLIPLRAFEERLEVTDLRGFNGLGMGANFAALRPAVDRVGGFDEILGGGGPLQSTQDFDFAYRVLRSGGTIVLDPKVIAYHYGVRPAADWPQLMRSYGIGLGGFYCKHIRLGDLRAAQLFAKDAYLAVGRALKATALQRPDARAKRSYAASIMRGARRSFEFSIDRGARLYVIRRTTGAA
jgi:GT2 family glycosyltransferase